MADTATPIETENTPSTGMIPMQGAPENTTVTAPEQQPVQAGETPSTYTLPSAAAPDYSNPSAILPHEGWMMRALRATSNMLAGDQTIHITKDKDGNVTMTHDPSTEGEKWGRIAAAALSGAAAGLANSQGPGGLARAGAAGFQAGAQIPQQREQQAQQQVDFGNKEVMFKANHAALDQKYIQNAEIMRQNNIKFNDEEADRQNKIQADRAMADGYEDVGDFNGVSDLPSFAAKFPDAMKAHTVGDGKYLTFQPIIDSKTGLQTGSHVGMMNVSSGNMPMKNPPPIPQSYYDPDSKTIKTRDITPASGIKRNDYEAAVKAQTAENSKLAIDVDKAKQTALDREQAEKDRVTNQQATQAARRDSTNLQREIAQGKGFISGEPVPPAPAGKYDPAFPPIQNFPANTEGIVKKNIGKPTADVAKAARLGKSAIQNSQDAINIIQAHPDLVGRLNSLGSRWQQAVGVSNDDPLTALQAAVEQSTQASLGAHNLRSAAYMRDKETEVTNNLKNDPASIVSYLQQRVRSNQQFIDEERNYNLYGTSYGPDRGHDVSREQQPGAAPTPQAQPAAQPQAAQPAAQPQGPKTAGPQFKPMTPPPNEPVHPGRYYGNGPKGVGWYK